MYISLRKILNVSDIKSINNNKPSRGGDPRQNGEDMKLEAIKRNAINEITRQKSLAADGLEFSPADIKESKRLITLIDEIVPQITPEEWSKIDSGIPGLEPSGEWKSSVKEIKDRLGLSWNEIELLRFSRGTVSEAQKKATAKYDAANTVQYHLKLNKTTDKDIIEKLDQVKSKQTYIKELIRRDLGRA